MSLTDFLNSNDKDGNWTKNGDWYEREEKKK
jgi:hypothetical protein